MNDLRRHQLARLSDAGWAAVLIRPWDRVAQACLAHWAAHGLPLVVTRQTLADVSDGSISLGLPAPARWDRRRLPLRVPRASVDGIDEFPRLDAVQPLLPVSAHGAMDALVSRLQACDAAAHVFGSYGWQALTGLDHLRDGSDLDLWLGVRSAAHADAVAEALLACKSRTPRLDGELRFDDGAAVAWREWVDWRAGRTRSLLVKRLHGVSLHRDIAWPVTDLSGTARATA